ncbi:esterase [Cladochytrium replicatum]|nr:esterase [Cladochytrium replicatum]
MKWKKQAPLCLLSALGLIVLIIILGFAVSGLVSRSSPLKKVDDWGGPNPNNLTLHIYAPSIVNSRPAIVLGLHWCTGSGQAFFQDTEWAQWANQLGFVLLMPSVPSSRNPLCWDVCSSQSLRHNGGSDTLTVSNMVRYAWAKYSSDASRTFVTGISSGGMMTQAMMATYPDMFSAGAEFAGVPFGCFETTDGSFWNDKCAKGNRTFSSSVWAEKVRAAYPGYTGTYPRFMGWHGTLDELISYTNFIESIKQWTEIHNASRTSSKDEIPVSNWNMTYYGALNATGQYQIIGVSEVGGNHGGALQKGMVKYVVEFFGIPVGK